MGSLPAGTLRHEVWLQTRSSNRNDFGEVTFEFSDSIRCRGNLQSLSAREFQTLHSVFPEASAKIELRAIDAGTINSDWRIKFVDRNSTRYFNIDGIVSDELGEKLTAYLSEQKF